MSLHIAATLHNMFAVGFWGCLLLGLVHDGRHVKSGNVGSRPKVLTYFTMSDMYPA